MPTSTYTKILLILTFVIFGVRAFAAPADVATAAFLKKANDPAALTSIILDGIRTARATEFTTAEAVIPKPLKASDLTVVQVEDEIFVGNVKADGAKEAPYRNSVYEINVPISRTYYHDKIQRTVLLKFKCEVLDSEELGLRVSCGDKPTNDIY
jgi:hypothetical protein